MTAVMDPPPAPITDAVEQPRPTTLIRVSANLLPDEVVAGRRLHTLKRLLAMALVGLVVLVAAAYGYFWWQTSQAEDELAAVQFDTQTMTAKVQSFAPLVQAQAKTAQIQGQLTQAMANDLQWSKLITNLNRAAGSAVQISSLTAQVTAGTADAATGDENPLNNTGLAMVGNLTLSGTAQDYRTVAEFVDTLSVMKGLAVVDPAQVTDTHGSVTFSVTLSMTTDVLDGRFSAPPGATPTAATPTATTGGN